MPEYICKALLVFTGIVLLGLQQELLAAPVKRGARWGLNALAGLTALLSANTLLNLWDLGLGLNGWTAGVSALLGPAGVGLLYGLRYLLFA